MVFDQLLLLREEKAGKAISFSQLIRDIIFTKMKVKLPNKLNVAPLLVAYTYFVDNNYVGLFISNILELFRYSEIQLVLPYYLLSC